MVGVGHDFVARQCQEIREESRVNYRGKGEAFEEGESKVRQCIHREVGAHWGEAEWSFPVEWHNVRSQACAQGPVRVGRPGLE